MPCRDYMDDNPGAYYGERLRDKEAEIERLQKKLSFAESTLCGVLTAIENAGFDIFDGPYAIYVDWEDAGVTSKEVQKWLIKHREVDKQIREKKAKADAAKLAKEMRERDEHAKKEQALKKLTPEERKLLGV